MKARGPFADLHLNFRPPLVSCTNTAFAIQEAGRSCGVHIGASRGSRSAGTCWCCRVRGGEISVPQWPGLLAPGARLCWDLKLRLWFYGFSVKEHKAKLPFFWAACSSLFQTLNKLKLVEKIVPQKTNIEQLKISVIFKVLYPWETQPTELIFSTCFQTQCLIVPHGWIWK